MKLQNKKGNHNGNKRVDEPLSEGISSDGILSHGKLRDGMLSDGILISRCHGIIHAISLVEAAD